MSNFKELTIKNGYAFFWGGWPSNWTISPFVIDDKHFNCVEQYMMYEKANCFNDLETAQMILMEKNPKNQKKLGREVKNYDDSVWDRVRYNVVLKGTVEKYHQNEQLKKKLFDTGDLIFVEASPYDRIWGVGLKETDPLILDEKNWKGLNLLGKAITEARAILREPEYFTI